MSSLLSSKIPPFLAMEFSKRASELDAQGHSIIKLSLGEPDFGAPPAVLDAMIEAMDGRAMPYTSALGLPELRRAIVDFYSEFHGVDVSPSRVVVTAGASAALLLVTAALVDQGDRVLMGDPSYPCYRHLMNGFGADVALVPTDETSRFQLNADLLRASWTGNTKGVMLASPSNPVGTALGIDELAQICRWVESQGGWRIIDEIYLGQSYGENGHRPPSVLSVDDGAIVINSFSKYFGMTGWRLGWCVVPEALVPAVERIAQNFLICPSTPAQYAALACFTPESMEICEARRQELKCRRDLALEGLRAAGLTAPVAPNGAFYIYIDVAETGLSSMEFCERALVEAGVALTPGNDFGVCGADRFVRLSYAISQEQLVQGLARLKAFVSRLNPSGVS